MENVSREMGTFQREDYGDSEVPSYLNADRASVVS